MAEVLPKMALSNKQYNNLQVKVSVWLNFISYHF